MQFSIRLLLWMCLCCTGTPLSLLQRQSPTWSPRAFAMRGLWSQLCTLWSHLSRLVFIVLTVSIVSQEPSSLDDKARKTAVPVDLDSSEPAVPASQGVSIHRMALRRLLPGVYYI